MSKLKKSTLENKGDLEKIWATIKKVWSLYIENQFMTEGLAENNFSEQIKKSDYFEKKPCHK